VAVVASWALARELAEQSADLIEDFAAKLGVTHFVAEPFVLGFKLADSVYERAGSGLMPAAGGPQQFAFIIQRGPRCGRWGCHDGSLGSGNFTPGGNLIRGKYPNAQRRETCLQTVGSFCRFHAIDPQVQVNPYSVFATV
jgi:hypothetical protein